MVCCDVLEIIFTFIKLLSFSPSNYFTLCCVNKKFLQEFNDKYKSLCLNNWFENYISTFYMNNLIHSYKNFEKISEKCFRFNLLSKTNLKPIVGIVAICNGNLTLTISSGYKRQINENIRCLNGYYRSNRFQNIKSLNKLKIILSSEFFDECLYIPKSQHTYTSDVLKTNVMHCSIKSLRFGE